MNPFKVGDRVYFGMDTQRSNLGVITSIRSNRWWVKWDDEPQFVIPYHSWQLVRSDFCDYFHDFQDRITDRLS